MNEELKNYVEKYIEYFLLDSKLGESELSKEEINEITDRLNELGDECRETVKRAAELMTNE